MWRRKRERRSKNWGAGGSCYGGSDSGVGGGEGIEVGVMVLKLLWGYYVFRWMEIKKYYFDFFFFFQEGLHFQPSTTTTTTTTTITTTTANKKINKEKKKKMIHNIFFIESSVSFNHFSSLSLFPSTELIYFVYFYLFI